MDADGGVIDDLTSKKITAHDSIQVGDSSNAKETTRIDGGSLSTGTLIVHDKLNADAISGDAISGNTLEIGKNAVTGKPTFTVSEDGWVTAEYGADISGVRLNGGRVLASGGLSVGDGKFSVDANGVLMADSGTIGRVTMVNGTINSYDQQGNRDLYYDGEGNLELSGDVTADGALSAMNGNFNVNEDGLTYTTNGSVTSDLAELRVTGDGATLRYLNNGVMVQEDGVHIAGGFYAGNDLFYVADDGSFTAGGGNFTVSAKGDVHANGTLVANQMYVGSQSADNAVVTQGDLDKTIEGVTNSSVQWDDPQSKDSINGVGLKDGNVTAGTITTTGDVHVGGDLYVGGDKVVTSGDMTTINNMVNDHTQAIQDIKGDIGDVSALKGTDANGNKYTNLTDAVNGNYDAIQQTQTQVQQNTNAISSLSSQVNDLGGEIDNVGAISAALAGLHPLDYDGTGSKFQLAAAMGSYDGSQAAAIGGFYHFNEDVMMSVGGATAFDGDNKSAFNVGVSFRVGQGSSGKKVNSDDVLAQLNAMNEKIAALEAENQQLSEKVAALEGGEGAEAAEAE